MENQTIDSQDINRDKVLEDLSKYVRTDTLMRHLLAVEAAMTPTPADSVRTRSVGALLGWCMTSIGKSCPVWKSILNMGQGFCGGWATLTTSCGRC